MSGSNTALLNATWDRLSDLRAETAPKFTRVRALLSKARPPREPPLEHFARGALGQFAHDGHAARVLEGGEPAAAMGHELVRPRPCVGAQGHEGCHLLAERGVRNPHHG